MMLSVCIPIHNYDVLPLVQAIARQIGDNAIDAEIVCVDDGSTPQWQEHNAPIAALGKYHCLQQNVGRAEARNTCLAHAEGQYLIFLDDDCIIPPLFMANYAAIAAKGEADVVVGGRLYDTRFDDRGHRLRYLYGTRVECRTADQRRKDPYRSFMTNNFMIRRSVLEKFPFDSRLRNYGHEDTLFGYRLLQAQIGITHVDNPVTNGDVEDNALFLRKTVEAVGTLSEIYDMLDGDPQFCSTVRLLNTYNKVNRLHLGGLLHFGFRLSHRALERRFTSGRCFTLPQFSFYKLGVFIGERRK